MAVATHAVLPIYVEALILANGANTVLIIVFAREFAIIAYAVPPIAMGALVVAISARARLGVVLVFAIDVANITGIRTAAEIVRAVRLAKRTISVFPVVHTHGAAFSAHAVRVCFVRTHRATFVTYAACIVFVRTRRAARIAYAVRIAFV